MADRFKFHSRRRKSGGSISELGAAIALILPITLIAGLVAFQISQVYMIKTTLEFAAEQAARRLAIAYGQDSVSAQAFPEKVFDTIRIAGIVKSSDQFNVPDGTSGWNTAVSPATVTVNVVFQGGKYGLPPFPNPDPLGLGSGFSISASGTCTLE